MMRLFSTGFAKPFVNIFLRQCLTETGTKTQTHIIQLIFDALNKSASHLQATQSKTGLPVTSIHFHPGAMATTAKWNGNFRELFTEETGQLFTPDHFQQWREVYLKKSDLFVSARTSMSESTSFEMGYFVAQCEARGIDPWPRIFIIAPHPIEIKTTLLKKATVIEFDPNDFSSITQNITQTIFESPKLAHLFHTPDINNMKILRVR